MSKLSMKSPYTRMYANENCVTQLQNDNAVEQWLLLNMTLLAKPYRIATPGVTSTVGKFCLCPKSLGVCLVADSKRREWGRPPPTIGLINVSVSSLFPYNRHIVHCVHLCDKWWRGWCNVFRLSPFKICGPATGVWLVSGYAHYRPMIHGNLNIASRSRNKEFSPR